MLESFYNTDYIFCWGQGITKEGQLIRAKLQKLELQKMHSTLEYWLSAFKSWIFNIIPDTEISDGWEKSSRTTFWKNFRNGKKVSKRIRNGWKDRKIKIGRVFCSNLHLFESSFVRIFICSKLHLFESSFARIRQTACPLCKVKWSAH